MQRGSSNGRSFSSAWRETAGEAETVTVRRWKDTASGKMFEEVEPVPAPPQGDYRRSNDGMRRKLSALLGRGANAFAQEKTPTQEELNAAEEEEAAKAEAEALRPQRSAEDVQRAYERGHAVDLHLAAQGSNRRDAVAEVDADGFPAVYDDRIHSLNVDALRIAADPALQRRGGIVVPESNRRGADVSLSAGGAGLQLDYITSILKDAGLVNDTLLRGQEAAVEASAGAGAGARGPIRKPERAVHTDARNQQMGEAAGSQGLAQPLEDGAVRKVLAEFLSRALARDGSSLAAAPSAPDHQSTKVAPEILGRALLQALAEFSPAAKQREGAAVMAPAKLAALEARLGKALLGRADLGVITSAGPQKMPATPEERVREVVLNTLAIKVADALESSAATKQGSDVYAAKTRSETHAGVREAPDDLAARVAAARVLLGALLGSDAEAAAASREGGRGVLRAGQSWGETLQRLAREASADGDSGALFSIHSEDVAQLEAKLLVALDEGVRVSERISRAMLGSSTVEAPQVHTAQLSQEDRTIVSRLLALNAASEVGAPMERMLSGSDAALRQTYESHREMVGRNESSMERVGPEALLRAWVRSGAQDRALAAHRDAVGLVQAAPAVDAAQEALQAAAAVLKARASAKAVGLEEGPARSTSPRRGVQEHMRIEAKVVR